MSERLIIRNFAGIREIDILIGEINILIGPQATGKSICAKLLYFFKSFIEELVEAIELDQTKREFDTNILQKFHSYFPSNSLAGNSYLLRYEVNDCFIQVEKANAKPRLTYSEYYRKTLNTWKKNLRDTNTQKDTDKVVIRSIEDIAGYRTQFYHAQATHISPLSNYLQLFIPAGRSFFAVLQHNIFSFLSSNNAVDPFLTEFGAFYEAIKRYQNLMRPLDEAGRKLRSKIESIIEPILQGTHMTESRKDYLVLFDGRKIELANASSGQQAMLPLALILMSIPFYRVSGRSGITIYIEEPEAHLFPTAQRAIVNLIATIFNESRIPVQFIITTHSPYILTALNNLLQAGNLSEDLASSDMSKLENVVPEEQFLKTENVRVYSLHDGTCESILSEETGLITTSSLDAVSDELASQFDAILAIE